jgi:Neuraminidase (sialidase)
MTMKYVDDEDVPNWSYEMSHDDGKTWQLSQKKRDVRSTQEDMAWWAYLCFINDLPCIVRLVRIL